MTTQEMLLIKAIERLQTTIDALREAKHERIAELLPEVEALRERAQELHGALFP